MQYQKKLRGRPVLDSGQRSKKIDARFTQEEFEQIIELEKELGINRTDLIRMRLLNDAGQTVINARKLITALDTIGEEMSKTAKHISELTKRSDDLYQPGQLTSDTTEKYIRLLEKYNINQQSLAILLRKIIRQLMK